MGKGRKNARRQAEVARFLGTYIIPVMGPTGSGKSSFINQLLGGNVVTVGHSLSSCTTDLEPVDVPGEMVQQHLPLWDPGFSKPAKTLIIVDTPGFDDTTADDSEILKRIADWLAETYGAGAQLAGVIYLQDICQRRVTGATKRNFEVFDKLCGRDACKSVVLGTTQWGRVPKDERAAAEARERELKEKFWIDMIGKGSRVERVEGNASSPWELVETVLYKGKSAVLQIQDEMEHLGKTLPQTEAAQVLRRRIEELIKSLKSGGATKDELRAFADEVEALKERTGLGGFLRRIFSF